MIKPDRIVSTTCPYCGVGCTLQLHVKDDFIFKVTSPFDSPVNHGNLCVKGRFGYDYVYHPKRVTTPLIRKTPQKAGERTQAFDLSEWREVTWDEALDFVADRLVEIYRRDGSDAMAVYACAKATNEDNYLLQKMYRTIFRTNNIDHCTRLCHAGSVVALQQAIGSSAMSNTASQVTMNDVFIVTGSNTTENHPIISLQMKEAVEKHGAKMIVIDPRRIELVDFAEMWLPLKPGTNVPVFTAMAYVIVEENLVNHDFINDRTEGYTEFLSTLEKFTPEYAEQISGVPAEDIRKAARLYAKAKNAAIYWGMGISQLSHGTASALALIHLAFLTGHIGRDGTGLNPLRGQNNVQGASDMGAMPFHYPGYMRVDDEANAARWEQVWNIEPGGLALLRAQVCDQPGHLVGEGLVVLFRRLGPDIAAGSQHMAVLADVVQRGSLAEARHICINTRFRFTAPRMISASDLIDIGVGEFFPCTVDHVAEFAGIDEQDFIAPVPQLVTANKAVGSVAGEEPKADRNLRRIEKT